MPIKIRAVVAQNVSGGEFVNKETGEVIKYEAGSLCHVWLPGEEFPSLYKIKGVNHPPKTEGQAMLTIAIRKEKIVATITDFTLSVKA